MSVAQDGASAPLWSTADPQRAILWDAAGVVTLGVLAGRAAALARALPPALHIVNLCEQRAHFLALYCAALIARRTNLLPQARAPQVLAEVLAGYPGATACDDAWVERVLGEVPAPVGAATSVQLPRAHVAQIVFTSGSTGAPQAHLKRWGSLLASTACNAARLRECAGEGLAWIVATVPAQHMYGCETSVLLPLAADMAVHAGRPLFPADVAAALEQVPAPRVLVSTPVHLRTLTEAAQPLPPLAAVVSATAPLDAALAQRIERCLGAPLLEMFGSTETCVIATRRTAHEVPWHLYPGVQLHEAPSGTRVEAPWFDVPTPLSDRTECVAPDRFVLRGRSHDMVEVAGKRASLADLTRRLLAVTGVQDAIVFQPEDAPQAGGAGVVRRVAALVVAPGASAEDIRRELSGSIDAAFVPRPLLIVRTLPRNAVGKLTREALAAALRAAEPTRPTE